MSTSILRRRALTSLHAPSRLSAGPSSGLRISRTLYTTSTSTILPLTQYQRLQILQRRYATETSSQPRSIQDPPPSSSASSSQNISASSKSSTISQSQSPISQDPHSPIPSSQLDTANTNTTSIIATEEAEREKQLQKVKERKEKEKAGKSLPQRAWMTVKKEAAHYWAGTKLLGSEIKISTKLTWRVLNGAELTRRERRQVSHDRGP